jgi:hypothetical protein
LDFYATHEATVFYKHTAEHIGGDINPAGRARNGIGEGLLDEKFQLFCSRVIAGEPTGRVQGIECNLSAYRSIWKGFPFTCILDGSLLGTVWQIKIS